MDMTFNKFGVALNANGIVMLIPPRSPLSDLDAINLAAWLVAVSGKEAEFTELLTEVKKS